MKRIKSEKVNGSKRIAIIQSAYVPWRGFFDMIANCDEYVILDGAQFVKRHWHNRNVVKSRQGPIWLTIPVKSKSRFFQPIDTVTVATPNWADKHWETIFSNYSRAPNFKHYSSWLHGLYRKAGHCELLSDINEFFIREISGLLGIPTHITRDSDYQPTGQKSDRLIDICLKAGATHYLSGPSASSYLEEDKFAHNGIDVEWMNYQGYPPYNQLWGEFVPNVSIIDLLLNVGNTKPSVWRRKDVE